MTGGTQALGGANTYAGATTINSGATLALVGNGSLATSSGVADDGTFDIAGTSAGASIQSLTAAARWSRRPDPDRDGSAGHLLRRHRGYGRADRGRRDANPDGVQHLCGSDDGPSQCDADPDRSGSLANSAV